MDIASLQSLISTGEARNISSSTGVQSGTDNTPVQTNKAKDVVSSDMADIASRYDVKHLSAKQVNDLVNELNSKGLISLTDFVGLALVPLLMENGDKGASMAMGPDGAIDLPKYWEIVCPPKYKDSGLKLFDTLLSNHKDKTDSGKTAATAQSSVDVQAAAKSYTDAISKTTADPQSVANVLEALASYPKDKSASSNA